MKKNPFHEVVALFNDKPVTVTIPLLDSVRKIMQDSGVTLQKYSDVFSVLEFLDKNNALELITTESGSHLIRNKYVENK